MLKSPMKNQQLKETPSEGLEALLDPENNSKQKVADSPKNPWEGLDQNEKRTGKKPYTIQFNEYEATIIEEAAKKSGINKTSFMRQAITQRAKFVLEID